MINFLDRCRFPDRFIRSKMECKEGLFGIGGSGYGQTRTNQLGAWHDLTSLFNWATPTGENQITTGAGNLNTAANFWNTLLSGNKPAIAQTLGPEISTLQNQTQQAVNTAGQFGNRSGGTNATLQTLSTGEAADVTQLVDTLIPTAAQEVAAIGATQEQLGTNVLNTGETAISTVGQQATEFAPTQLQLQESIEGNILDTLINANLFGGQSIVGLLGEG